MHLGRNVEEIMDKELKEQIYKVLIDKIDIKTFEKSKKELIKLIRNVFSKEELLSLMVYEKCLKIIQNEGYREFYNLLEYFSNQYVENDFEYNVFYGFYSLNNKGNLLEIGYNVMEEKQIIKSANEYSEFVLGKFNFHKKNEDWDNFLRDSSYYNFDFSENQKKKLISKPKYLL